MSYICTKLYFMSRKLLYWTLPFVVLLLSWSSIDVDSKTSADELKVANELIDLVNQHRLSIGKPLLVRNATADQLAQEHANYMIEKQEVTHDNYDKRWDVLEQKENADEVTENLGFDVTADKALAACLSNVWLKANVEGDFTHTGLAVKKDDQGRYFYTQIFFKK